MAERITFAVVEDNTDDFRDILARLADAKFKLEDKIGTATTFEEAKRLLEEHATHLDVFFLDLNLPRNEKDGRPEKRHGHELLKFIHQDLNRRPDISIKVIIVSAEDLHDGMQADTYRELFKGTLEGIVQKANLTKMLQSSLRRLRKDPLRNRLVSKGLVDIVDAYDTVFDPTQPIRERAISARKIAIRLVGNEVDHFQNTPNFSQAFPDNLNGLIKEHIETRFTPDDKGRRYPKTATIQTAGGWGAFLWRGHLLDNLYALNNYRNLSIHLPEQPFQERNGVDAWDIPVNMLDRLSRGETMGKVIGMLVKELLEWYLPWHEQVFLPWKASVAADEKDEP